MFTTWQLEDAHREDRYFNLFLTRMGSVEIYDNNAVYLYDSRVSRAARESLFE